MSQILWRKNVTKLKKYVPGKAIEEVKKEYGFKEVTRLASNENPYGPSPKAIRAMQEAVQESHFYPETSCKALRDKIGDKLGIDPNHVVIGNGADHIIRLIGTAYINPGDEVIYCTPTFPTYRIITTLMGGVPVEIPLTVNHVYDLDAILEAVNDKTKLIFICNPNNPTGTIVESDRFRSFLDQLPKHIIVALDEAYMEFVQCKEIITGTNLIKEGYPIISIRTFSKLYGLAGTRIGYGMANSEEILPIQTVRETFAVNRIAHAGALAALDDDEYKNYVLEQNKEAMKTLKSGLEQLGYDVYPSHANFLFVNMKQDTIQIFDELLKKGIIIRPCKSWGMQTYARISIGTSEQNSGLIRALHDLQYS